MSLSKDAVVVVDRIDKVLGQVRPSILLLVTVALCWITRDVRRMARRGLIESIKELVFRFARRFFSRQLGIDKALRESQDSFAKSFAEKEARAGGILHDSLPDAPFTREKIMEIVEKYVAMNESYDDGQFSGSVYHDGRKEYTALINEVMGKFQWTNPLHSGQFSGVRKMEAEAIAMVVKLFHGDHEACGSMTSGGTESILLAIKAYREYAKAVRGIDEPEMVVPITAHAAFDKAAHYFNILIHHARVDPQTGKADVSHMRSLVNRNTICLVGSAPGFPHGIVDPIEDIAALALSHGIPMHVDACLGGFVIAFMEKAGYPLPLRFDFAVPGVTSISCDTHKYGFAPKGNSVIMYRNRELRRYQMHSQPNWPGGIYASPTIAGSRPGNVIAGTWAALMYHGMDGYVQSTKDIIETTRMIAAEAREFPGLTIIGEPLVSVIAFTSDRFDVFRLFQLMTERHWDLNNLQYPSSFHLCVTRMHTKTRDGERYIARRFLKDLRECCEILSRDPNSKPTGAAALYGTSQAVPDRSIIGDVAKMYFDAYYDVHIMDHAKKTNS
eukprot:Sspe_Gene.33022::Locus_16158_Transcript_2_2_Confidence_0.667_Length_1993::g.33022::m.33022/K01634/SGPL1, DPL1; sphinganine-1-phosphate aldolase